jgi:putative nucleotidyltransferase with HDIG domain
MDDQGRTMLDPAHRTPDVADLGALAQSPTIEAAVATVRGFLGMDLAYATRMDPEVQVLETMDGDADAFGLHEGKEIPLEQTYCNRVLAGRLPNLIPDVQADERAAALPISQALGVGAFVSVPLTFSDGSLYGTLCAGSRDAKPDLGYRDLQFLHVFARMVSDQLEREKLLRDAEQLQEVAHGLELQAAAAGALITAVQARDSYTAEHSRAVVDEAVAVAREMGLEGAQRDDVRNVALLHDIGKIAVPDAILAKPGPLDEEEWEVMRSHPASSQEMVRQIPGLEHLAPMVRAEHERWDGTGYPDGLAGEDIPLPSRITLACDAFHAMTSDRPYRAAMSVDDARAEIAANLGTQFCPHAGSALLAVLSQR